MTKYMTNDNLLCQSSVFLENKKNKYILKKIFIKILFDFEGGRCRHEFITVITTYSFIHCFASYHNALMTILF